MQNKLKYDSVPTNLSTAIVIWEDNVKEQGHNPETTNDHCPSACTPSPFVGSVESMSMLQYNLLLLPVLHFKVSLQSACKFISYNLKHAPLQPTETA